MQQGIQLWLRAAGHQLGRSSGVGTAGAELIDLKASGRRGTRRAVRSRSCAKTATEKGGDRNRAAQREKPSADHPSNNTETAYACGTQQLALAMISDWLSLDRCRQQTPARKAEADSRSFENQFLVRVTETAAHQAKAVEPSPRPPYVPSRLSLNRPGPL